MNRMNWVPKQHTRICNEYFTAGMYSGRPLLEEATFTEDGGGGRTEWADVPIVFLTRR